MRVDGLWLNMFERGVIDLVPECRADDVHAAVRCLLLNHLLAN